MEIRYDDADKSDIEELIELRLAYIREDFGETTPEQRVTIRAQLQDYFLRKLGIELIAFTARDAGQIIGVAYLQIIEMPANPNLKEGLYGVVLNVYTEPEYRGRGICTTLMRNLLDYGRLIGLGRIDLSATKEGYPIYEKLGFREKDGPYREMRYQIRE